MCLFWFKITKKFEICTKFVDNKKKWAKQNKRKQKRGVKEGK